MCLDKESKIILFSLMFYYIHVSKTFIKINNKLKIHDLEYVYIIYLLYSFSIYDIACNKNTLFIF